MASSKAGISYFPADADSASITAFRIVSPRWEKTALSGEGARRYGGRWNSPGRPMVYLSTARSLAALELLVHLTTPESRKISRIIIAVNVPRDLIGGRLWKAPGWDQDPPALESTEQGDDWLSSGSTVGVYAPSAIIPEEDNLLLNPNHSDFSRIEILGSAPFSFDPRLAER